METERKWKWTRKTHDKIRGILVIFVAFGTLCYIYAAIVLQKTVLTRFALSLISSVLDIQKNARIEQRCSRGTDV